MPAWSLKTLRRGRLDAFLAARLTQFSRVQLRRAITEGAVQVDGQQAKPSYRLLANQEILLHFPQPLAKGPQPEAIALEVLFEDQDLIVVNKPPAMVVHPGKGHWSGTLTSALAHHFGELSTVGGPARPGIVHRLDRDTSGVIVVVRNDQAHRQLARQFAERTVQKQYQAIVRGVPDRDRDRIDEPIGPHPHHREKMAIRRQHPDAREAQTDYEVIQRFRGFALLLAKPKTGRTHQIRVHLTHAGYPILCDKLYGGGSEATRGDLLGRHADQASKLVLTRQALHAFQIEFQHPRTQQRVRFEAPLPSDIQRTLAALSEPAAD